MPAPASAATIPLISTTASLSFALFEILVFRGLVAAASIDHSAAARAISAWWQATYFQGLSLIVTTGAVSLSGGIHAIRSYPAGSSERRLAMLGTAFAVGHFAFAPLVVPVIDAMCAVYNHGGHGAKEAKVKGRPEESEGVMRERDERSIELQRQWNHVHLIRSVVVDLPAMLCFTALALWD